VALSNRFSVEALDELYSGIKAACEFYEIDLVGGDTTSSRSGLVISVTAIGMAQPQQIVKRNTAKAHDIICLTGDIGAAYLGLQVLEREKQVFLADPNMQPELIGKDYVLERQLRPEARLDWIKRLRELNIVPTAMIDVSDGLASEILHLCGQSKVGAVLYEERLPLDNHTFLAAEDLKINPLTAALNGGEDFELLFTVSQADYAKIETETDLSVIGYMTADATVVDIITKSGNTYPVKAQGFKQEE
jgi:thiamine-monophosphate kinase